MFLNMLELAHLPVFASERTNYSRLVFGGGPSAVNPEADGPFMDLL